MRYRAASRMRKGENLKKQRRQDLLLRGGGEPVIREIDHGCSGRWTEFFEMDSR
jgi:hypothetical protein